jgi:acyl carrier protein
VTDTERRVIKVLEAVFARKQMAPPPLTLDTVLDRTLGLESLDFAEFVVRLELEFNKDPFAGDSVPSVRHLKDLAALYA